MAARLTRGTVHIIGGGLAGLSCAVALLRAGTHVKVHEAARFAGGPLLAVLVLPSFSKAFFKEAIAR